MIIKIEHHDLENHLQTIINNLAESERFEKLEFDDLVLKLMDEIDIDYEIYKFLCSRCEDLGFGKNYTIIAEMIAYCLDSDENFYFNIPHKSTRNGRIFVKNAVNVGTILEILKEDEKGKVEPY